MPSTILFGELNTFVGKNTFLTLLFHKKLLNNYFKLIKKKKVDTTGAGEGNLEVIIKDGYDTLNAQLLKREKRKFEIGFFCERNMKHDIQVIFNGQQIKGLKFAYVIQFVLLILLLGDNFLSQAL